MTDEQESKVVDLVPAVPTPEWLKTPSVPAVVEAHPMIREEVEPRESRHTEDRALPIIPVKRSDFDKEKERLGSRSALERVFTHREPGEFRDSFDLVYDEFGHPIGAVVPVEDLYDDAAASLRAADFADRALNDILARTGKTVEQLVAEVQASEAFDVPAETLAREAIDFAGNPKARGGIRLSSRIPVVGEPE